MSADRFQHPEFVVPSPRFSSAAGAGFHSKTTSVMLDGRLVGRLVSTSMAPVWSRESLIPPRDDRSAFTG